MIGLRKLGRLLGLCLVLAGSQQAQAADPVLLTVVSDGEETTFTRADLEALGTEEFETTTIWTEGIQHFRGVPLGALAARFDVGADGFRAVAINDYIIDIPRDDAREGAALLALEANGEPMSVRDRGPIWLVYPYDSDPVFQTEVIYARSVWQLTRLEVLD